MGIATIVHETLSSGDSCCLVLALASPLTALKCSDLYMIMSQAAASPVTKHPMQTVQDNSLTRFEQLARFAGAHDALSKPNVRMTILAPTDQVGAGVLEMCVI